MFVQHTTTPQPNAIYAGGKYWTRNEHGRYVVAGVECRTTHEARVRARQLDREEREARRQTRLAEMAEWVRR